MKFDEMFLAIKEANKRFYKISKLREKIALTQEKKNFEIRDKNQKILESLENKTEEFLKFEIDKFEQKLDRFVNEPLDTLSEELAQQIKNNLC